MDLDLEKLKNSALCVDGNGRDYTFVTLLEGRDFPLVMKTCLENDREYIDYFTLEGEPETGDKSRRIRIKPIMKTYWVNLYWAEGGGIKCGKLYRNKLAAENYLPGFTKLKYIKTISVVCSVECEE